MPSLRWTRRHCRSRRAPGPRSPCPRWHFRRRSHTRPGGYRAVDLDFGGQGSMAMLIVVPDKMDLFVSGLTAAKFASILKGQSPYIVTLALPRFSSGDQDGPCRHAQGNGDDIRLQRLRGLLGYHQGRPARRVQGDPPGQHRCGRRRDHGRRGDGRHREGDDGPGAGLPADHPERQQAVPLLHPRQDLWRHPVHGPDHPTPRPSRRRAEGAASAEQPAPHQFGVEIRQPGDHDRGPCLSESGFVRGAGRDPDARHAGPDAGNHVPDRIAHVPAPLRGHVQLAAAASSRSGSGLACATWLAVDDGGPGGQLSNCARSPRPVPAWLAVATHHGGGPPPSSALSRSAGTEQRADPVRSRRRERRAADRPVARPPVHDPAPRPRTAPVPASARPSRCRAAVARDRRPISNSRPGVDPPGDSNANRVDQRAVEIEQEGGGDRRDPTRSAGERGEERIGVGSWLMAEW